MMFLIRMAFWLAIIVLLLPTDAKQQEEIYGTAQAAVKDLSGFCDRNPDACAMAKDVAGVFVQKAEFGAQVVMNFVKAKAGAGTDEASAQSSSAGPASESATWAPVKGAPGASQDTLNPADLQPAWSAPARSGT